MPRSRFTCKFKYIRKKITFSKNIPFVAQCLALLIVGNARTVDLLLAGISFPWYAPSKSHRHVGIGVSRRTEIVQINKFSKTKNPQVTLEFARKLSPGHQRVAVHRNSPKKRAQKVEKHQVHSKSRGTYLLGISVSRCTEIILENVLSRSNKSLRYTRIREEVITWASACRYPLKQYSKTCLAGRKIPEVQSK